MKPVLIKLAIAIVLFLSWVILVVMKVQGAEDLVSFIKTALEGLGLYHALTWDGAPAPEAEPAQSGAPGVPVAGEAATPPAAATVTDSEIPQ
ncbi:hypothetical protein [Achromobacter aloeverae]